MKRKILIIGIVLFVPFCAAAVPVTDSHSPLTAHIDEIILDIFNAASEFGEVEFEQLQTDLYALHETPIDLNHTSDEELSRLYFLTPRQIDDILLYADKHPFESLYELRLIPSLADYEIRDLLPFVQIINHNSEITNEVIYPKEVFAHANHEIITRVDARKIEHPDGTDPMFVQTRYRFDYQRRFVFGAQLRRPVGGKAEDLQYGAYIQLRDIGHLHTLTAGNFQASFGQGLVLAPVFHTGKSAYVASAGQQNNGLRYYSSVDGGGLHGTGATFRWNRGKATRLDVSALYSMKRANDSTWHHLVGANLTVRHQRLEVQLTAIENIWSDSIRPYSNAKYNHHYFRGFRQFVGGASVRYNFGVADLFGEFATAQNYLRFAETTNSEAIDGEGANSEALNSPHWGFGAIAGGRFYPASGVSLIALYRYYSPFFDNALGYAFSETSRLGDENGGYLGFDLTRWQNWKISGYADVFYFSGIKYGIPQAGTIGYDVMTETQYIRPVWRIGLRLRARKKGELSTYSARAQFDWKSGGWSLRTIADANLTDPSPMADNPSAIHYGVSLAQDIAYDFSQLATPGTKLPLTLRLRLQGFDAREWNNRIYLYEHDILYAFSIPATYGLGGRAYVCLKWQIIPQLALYMKVSETVTQSATRTDIHFLLRAKL